MTDNIPLRIAQIATTHDPDSDAARDAIDDLLKTHGLEAVIAAGEQLLRMLRER